MAFSVPQRDSPTRPAGDDEGAWLAVLEQGSTLLQSATPLHGFDIYVVGFHCAKFEPHMQMEAHHYCKVVNDELLQCTIFDGNSKHANLIGIEYIIAERLFNDLPAQEKPYWHPHNYEVLSGELLAPGLPDTVEQAVMQRLLNSYGKTWHTWHTGRHDGAPGDALPLGEAKLMWSFSRLGECDPALQRNRDQVMDLDTAGTREQRQSLVNQAHPQQGVDALADCFSDTTRIAGVVDQHEHE